MQRLWLLFADSIPEQAEFDRYYEEMSKYEHSTTGGRESNYDLRRFRVCAEVIVPLLPDKQTRILEIGCGTGGLLGLLKVQGFEHVQGVDPSPACAATAQQLHQVSVTAAKFSSLPFPDGSFDCIILVGVLEHVHALTEAIATVSALLAPGGLLYVVVPDASRYAQGLDAPFQEFSVEHINFFGPFALKHLLLNNGFSNVACQQQLVEVNHRTWTPMIHAVFRKEQADAPVRSIGRDAETERGLLAYIEQSSRTDERIRGIIDEIVRNAKPIIVWGTGAHTLRLLETSQLREATISVFVDSNPRYQGKSLLGIPIIAPAQLSGRTEPILISSRPYQEDIATQIRQVLKLPNDLIRLYDIE